jgi:hypothetical protein
MAMYEVVLRLNGTSEERLHDRRLCVGQRLNMRGIEWIVQTTEPPRNPRAERRYICVPRFAEPSP